MNYRQSTPPYQGRRSPPKPPKPWWATVGIVLATVVGIAGLAVLGVIILAFVLLGTSGSNK
jgi:hypothetical protein